MTEVVAVLTGVVLAVILLPLGTLAVDWLRAWWIDRGERSQPAQAGLRAKRALAALPQDAPGCARELQC